MTDRLLALFPNYNTGLYWWYGRFRGYLQSWLWATEDIDEVMPGIYISGIGAAYNREKLLELGITHVVNAVMGLPEAFPDDFQYLDINLRDQSYEDIRSKFEESNQFIKKALADGGKVLVHCLCGVSRSASLVTAYKIAEENGQCFVWKIVKTMQKRRPVVNPNSGFRLQLEEYAKSLRK